METQGEHVSAKASVGPGKGWRWRLDVGIPSDQLPGAPLTDPSTHCDSRMAPQHPKKPTAIIKAPAPTST